MIGRRGGPRIAFLPTYHGIMSSLLRVERIAPELERLGWRSLVVPPHLVLSQRRRVLDLYRPDIVFMQKSRHELNDPALLLHRPFVYDIDDADFLDPRLTDRMRRTCEEAAAVICGSRYVRDWCARWSDNAHVVWTPAAAVCGTPVSHERRAPIVTWAQREPLRYAREFAFVADVMTDVATSGPVTLRLYGCDEADRRKVPEFCRLEAAGVTIELLPTMVYDDFVRSLRECAIGLSPLVIENAFSKGKSFGKILGYLDAGVPVVASAEADHEVFFADGAGIVSNDRDVWVRGIVELLASPPRREEMARRARAMFEKELAPSVAARKIDAILRPLLAPGGGERGEVTPTRPREIPVGA